MAGRDMARILVINPNTTQAMTDALKPLLSRLGSTTATFEYFTAPFGPPSINSKEDGYVSALSCLTALQPLLSEYDAFLVACYSPHPLVYTLRSALLTAGLPAKPVTGIFEASIGTCLASLNDSEKFGIVSTGSQWKAILDDAITKLLGSHASGSSRYAGTETTGLNANELHDAPKTKIAQLIGDATIRLIAADATAICLGCAGMVGLDVLVRQACIEWLGEFDGRRIRIVDGVVSGALHLESELRALALEKES